MLLYMPVIRLIHVFIYVCSMCAVCGLNVFKCFICFDICVAYVCCILYIYVYICVYVFIYVIYVYCYIVGMCLYVCVICS